MAKKYELTGAEIEFMRNAFSLILPFDGMDKLAAMTETERDESMEAAKKRMIKEGWIMDDGTGSLRADEEFFELFDICGSFDIAVGVEEGRQGSSDRNIYFFTRGSQMAQVEEGAVWSLEKCSANDLRTDVNEAVIWDDKNEPDNDEANGSAVIVRSEILEEFQARNQFEFDTTWNMSEFMQMGLERKSAKLASDALADKLYYHHIWYIDASRGGKVESLTALQGNEGAILIKPTLIEGEDAVEISSINKTMYFQMIDALFHKEEGAV